MLVRATESDRPYYNPLIRPMTWIVRSDAKKRMHLCLSIELCRKIGRFGLFGFHRNKVGTKEVATFYGIDICNIVLVLGIHHVPFGICEQT